jgi:hypothetical protein
MRDVDTFADAEAVARERPDTRFASAFRAECRPRRPHADELDSRGRVASWRGPLAG